MPQQLSRPAPARILQLIRRPLRLSAFILLLLLLADPLTFSGKAAAAMVTAGQALLSTISAMTAPVRLTDRAKLKEGVTTAPATLTTSTLTPVEAFDANVTGPVGDSFVGDLAVQPDGRILIVGRFTSVGGQARDRLARLNSDGTIDAAFNPTGLGDVREVTVQPDGKILIGGAGNNDRQNYVARLNSDGSLDSSFNAESNGAVYAVIAQFDGKALVAGQFSVIGGQTRTNIARLNADGTADTGFNASTDSTVAALATQPDGKILLAGYFTSVNGQPRNRLARLNANGTLDSGFNPNLDFNTSNEHRIDGILVQPDGRILIAGHFTSVDGQPRNALARLNSDGSLDAGFNANADSSVSAFALQTDGRILAGGQFASLGGQARQNIARLNADGSADTSFNAETNDAVLALATQADGRTLVGGYFTVISQQSRNFLARLTSPTAATQSLAVNASGTATWTRDGASPEIDRATFEYSTDAGTNWISFGNSSRLGTTANWQMTGLAFPLGQDFLLRARGWQMHSGLAGDASGYETVQTFFLPAPPTITQHPVSQSACHNSSVSLAVTATGTAPLSYQWRRDGVNLSNGGAVSGATTATLTTNPFTSAEAGSYDCVVTNTAGTVISNAATLTVNFPLSITTQPVGQNAAAGAAVSFNAASNPAAAVQWQVSTDNGTNFSDVSGATATTLSFTATAAHHGNQYRAVFSNACGSVTTNAAALTVTGNNNIIGLLISEFRFRGSGGLIPANASTDEFVEIANRSDSPVTVSSSDGSAGWAVAALDDTNNPVVLLTIPNGTVIPPVGRWLGVNSQGYSLADYGGSNAAAGDSTWTFDIPDGSGLALFTTATSASFSTTTRLDAVGFSGVSNALFREGAGLTPIGGITTAGEFTFLRRLNQNSGLPEDTGSNGADFDFLATSAATFNGRVAELGAPGPENSSSPRDRNGGGTRSANYPQMTLTLLDPAVAANANPNQQTGISAADKTGLPGLVGSIYLRRTYTNNTGAPVTKLRLRIVELTTLNSPIVFTPKQAQFRVMSSTDQTVTVGGVPTLVKGLTLEEAPTQSLGGGINATLVETTINGGAPLAPGASVRIVVRLGAISGGTWLVRWNVEVE